MRKISALEAYMGGEQIAMDNIPEKSVKDELAKYLEDSSPSDFDESKHPRAGKGEKGGGQFKKSNATIEKEDDLGGSDIKLPKEYEGLDFKKEGDNLVLRQKQTNKPHIVINPEGTETHYSGDRKNYIKFRDGSDINFHLDGKSIAHIKGKNGGGWGFDENGWLVSMQIPPSDKYPGGLSGEQSEHDGEWYWYPTKHGPNNAYEGNKEMTTSIEQPSKEYISKHGAFSKDKGSAIVEALKIGGIKIPHN